MNHDLVISACSVDITPERPVALGGYGRRIGPFRSIADGLEANVVTIRSGRSRVTIISTDLLYPGEQLRNELLQSGDIAGDENELFLCASHTHYAPMTASTLPGLGGTDPGYVREIAARIISRVKSIRPSGNPYTVTYHQGILHHSLERRLRHLRLKKDGLKDGIDIGPNPEGKTDEGVRILKFCDSSGKPLAVLWNYACHPCEFLDDARVSSAFPGVVRSHLRAEFGAVPILFLQGFAGNVRPPFTGIPHGLRGLAKRILWGPQFRGARPREWRHWSNGLARSVVTFCRSSPQVVKVSPPVARRIAVPEGEFAVDGDGDKSLVWHLVDCGGFRIVGINAEPVVQYRELVAKYLGDAPLLTVGCLDETRCYLPTDEMIAEGGYEVEGFRRPFGFKGRFRHRIQEDITRKLDVGAASGSAHKQPDNQRRLG